MDDAIREFVALKLAWVFDEIPAQVRKARLQLGTNDVAVLLFPKGADNQSAEVFWFKRQDLYEELLQAQPPTPITTARIAELLPPNKVWVIVYAPEGLFCFRALLPQTDTVGVLN